MDYTTLGSGANGIKVSRVGLGTWAMGNDFFGTVDDDESVAAIQAAIDAGVTLIDTAPAYGGGHSEAVVGRAIRGRRDRVVISTKCGNRRTATGFERDFSPEYLRQGIEESLTHFGVEMIDIYFVHWPDPARPLEPGIRELIRLREQGKFRHLALSNFTVDLIDKVRDLSPVTCLQPHYSLLRREIESDLLPYCARHGIGVMSYGTLAGGVLTGKFREIPQFDETDRRGRFYRFFQEPLWGKIQVVIDVLRQIASAHDSTPAAVAINWALARVGSVLVGAKNPAQAAANAAAREWELSDDERSRIDSAWDMHLRKALAV